ncbi:hypothetical protein WS68_15535 [Burkholderia sp. TSV86]|nr:hypothetical protein WS68_15535 [Burkholderia sp. TSV86]
MQNVLKILLVRAQNFLGICQFPLQRRQPVIGFLKPSARVGQTGLKSNQIIARLPQVLPTGSQARQIPIDRRVIDFMIDILQYTLNVGLRLFAPRLFRGSREPIQHLIDHAARRLNPWPGLVHISAGLRHMRASQIDVVPRGVDGQPYPL